MNALARPGFVSRGARSCECQTWSLTQQDRLEVPQTKRDRQVPRIRSVRRDRIPPHFEEHVLPADVEIGACTEVPAELGPPAVGRGAIARVVFEAADNDVVGGEPVYG